MKAKGGGVGRQGTQPVENLVRDEIQEMKRAMKSEGEEEDHGEDVRKLVETTQKEEAEQEDQRFRVVPKYGAGG